MSKNNQNEYPIESQKENVACHEAKNKEENEDCIGVDKQKVTRRRKEGRHRKDDMKGNKAHADDSNQPEVQDHGDSLLGIKADEKDKKHDLF